MLVEENHVRLNNSTGNLIQIRAGGRRYKRHISNQMTHESRHVPHVRSLKS
jgi:hypothetical protein